MRDNSGLENAHCRKRTTLPERGSFVVGCFVAGFFATKQATEKRNLTRFCIHHIVNNKIAFYIGRVSFHLSTYESVYDCNSECIDWQFGAMIFRCLWVAAL